MFADFNPVKCTVPKKQSGRSRFGFVDFANENDASRALRSFKGKVINGILINVNYKINKKRGHNNKS